MTLGWERSNWKRSDHGENCNFFLKFFRENKVVVVIVVDRNS